MRLRHLLLALALSLVALPALAQDRPTPAQIDKLLEAMRTRQMIENMLPAIMQQSETMATQMLGPDATPAQREQVSTLLQRQQARMRETFTWANLAPIYRRIYGDVLSGKEVDAMARFYASPEGRSAMDKMPQLMQRSMVEMQPLLQKMIEDTRREIEQATAKPADTPAPPKRK